MKFKSDIEIAQSTKMKHITEIASALDINDKNLELYGNYKAKVNYEILEEYKDKPDGKLILVTAMTPTPAGEGKTTITIGLGDALTLIGKKTAIAVREPSLGPLFGVKGGSSGGGYAQVLPMEDINLHFTGDMHAISAANNLLAAMLDNHIFQGNELGIDVRKVTWRRCMDMNDRQLRYIVDGLNGYANGVPREDGFDITTASEVMAILCLSKNIDDLKEKLKKIVVGYTKGNVPVTAGDLNAEGAMAALLRDALKPNLAQTLEHTPAFIHGCTFANIAHGCSSLLATRMAMKLADYAITEAGFGSDLGAEKFINIKSRKGGLCPTAVVVVATVRALKYHGGCTKTDWDKENIDTLKKGIPNLFRHLSNIKDKFGLRAVVAVNRFVTDTAEELDLILAECSKHSVKAAICDIWSRGGAGGVELAEEVVRLTQENDSKINFIYSDEMTIEQKIKIVAADIYGADGVTFLPAASAKLKQIQNLGIEFERLPVCIAKTPYSFSDNPALLCSPKGFSITVKDIKICAGAGFIVALTGDVMTMPGLPKIPAAVYINVDSDGRISGLF